MFGVKADRLCFTSSHFGLTLITKSRLPLSFKGNSFLVRKVGLEPTRLSAAGSEPTKTTNSITCGN